MNLEQSFLPYLAAFGWISVLLLLGTWLRAKVSFFRTYLVPSSLIAGLLGFVLVSLGWIGYPDSTNGWTPISDQAFGLVAFHLFSFGFVAIGLVSGGGTEDGDKKEILKGSLWMALLWTGTACLQALGGWGIFLGYNAATGADSYAPLGFLAAHGFAQGPGQALAISTVWQDAFKIPGAVPVGLTFAAVGFFVAALAGVPLAYWGVKKGLARHAPAALTPEFLSGLMPADSRESVGRHTTNPANIDTLAFHLAVMGLIYFLAYLICYALKYHLFPPAMAELTFGFIFFWGLIAAVVVRVLMNKTGAGKYLDDGVQRRLTGATVDYMIVAVMMAVKLSDVMELIVPISLTILFGAAVTLFLVLYFGRRVKDFGFEKMTAMFGYLTGTGASALLLLRIVDADFRTPVAVQVGLMNLFSIFLFTHPVFLVSVMPGPAFPGPGQMAVIYLVTGLFCLVMIKVLGFWNKKYF
ncbi:MAG: sodium/glutamate symporter [Pseudomonadota bacterium]